MKLIYEGRVNSFKPRNSIEELAIRRYKSSSRSTYILKPKYYLSKGIVIHRKERGLDSPIEVYTTIEDYVGRLCTYGEEEHIVIVELGDQILISNGDKTYLINMVDVVLLDYKIKQTFFNRSYYLVWGEKIISTKTGLEVSSTDCITRTQIIDKSLQ